MSDAGIRPAHAADSFLADVGLALRAWRAHPSLPLSSLIVFGIWSAARSDGVLALLWCLVSVVAAGWCGSLRIWYLRAFRKKEITGAELIDFTVAFAWRFLKLGLLFALLVVPALIALFVLQRSRLVLWYAGVAISMVMDFLLTFVTPALAYSTSKVFRALSTGIRMIFEGWPRSLWYVLVPPLALFVAARTFSGPTKSAPLWMTFVLTVLALALGVLFRGATAAYYLRRVPVGDDGAGGRPVRTSSPPAGE